MPPIQEGYVLMQDENKAKVRRPKPRDGTLNTKPERSVNGFGPSQVPQEEFTENDPSPNDIHQGGNDSEGSPTFGSLRTENSERGSKSE